MRPILLDALTHFPAFVVVVLLAASAAVILP
ncbi:hypothetical protein ACSSVZ_002923 [Amorphus sp. MBR-141]